jgi:hypothetical protein
MISYYFGLTFEKREISGKKGDKIRSTYFRDAKVAIAKMAAVDDFFVRRNLLHRFNDLFVGYQKDWEAFDLNSMNKYMSDEFYQVNLLLLEALRLRKRKNVVDVDYRRLIRFVSYSPETDVFNVIYKGAVGDKLVDMRSSAVIYDNRYMEFEEKWAVRKVGSKLLIVDISQSTAQSTARTNKIRMFANNHEWIFRLDMGYLLLPEKGQLFRHGTFFKSNVDNYVIGRHKDLLIEMYTYEVNKYREPNTKNTYTVLQCALPKDYGSIVVKPNTHGKIDAESEASYIKIKSESIEFDHR